MKSSIKKVLLKSKLISFLYGKRLERLQKIYEKKMNKSFIKNGKQVFVDFLNVCNEMNVPCWLVYGTLLGYVRENGIIKHDYDFDVGIWFSDYNIEFKDALIRAGFKLTHQFKANSKYNAFEQSFEKNNVSIDVFYHYSDDSKIWTHVFYVDSNEELEKNLWKTRKLDYPKDKLKEILFFNTKCYIPNNSEEYLAEIYGKNWRIPDPNFNWRNGPKANCTVPGVFGVREDF